MNTPSLVEMCSVKTMPFGILPINLGRKHNLALICELDPGLVDEIRKATNGNLALGDTRLTTDIETAIGRRVVPGKSGRPHKNTGPVSAGLFE